LSTRASNKRALNYFHWPRDQPTLSGFSMGHAVSPQVIEL